MKQTQTPVPRPPTQLEILQAEKKRLKQQSLEQEEALAVDFQYLQENAGNLLMSGVSSLLFPGSKAKQSSVPAETTAIADVRESQPFKLTDLLPIAGSLLPVAWGIAQPMLISWGVNRAKHWLGSFIGKKKK